MRRFKYESNEMPTLMRLSAPPHTVTRVQQRPQKPKHTTGRQQHAGGELREGVGEGAGEQKVQ